MKLQHSALIELKDTSGIRTTDVRDIVVNQCINVVSAQVDELFRPTFVKPLFHLPLPTEHLQHTEEVDGLCNSLHSLISLKRGVWTTV